MKPVTKKRMWWYALKCFFQEKGWIFYRGKISRKFEKNLSYKMFRLVEAIDHSVIEQIYVTGYAVTILAGEYVVYVWVANKNYSDMEISFSKKTNRLQLLQHIEHLSAPDPATRQMLREKVSEARSYGDDFLRKLHPMSYYKSIHPSEVTEELIDEITCELMTKGL